MRSRKRKSASDYPLVDLQSVILVHTSLEASIIRLGNQIRLNEKEKDELKELLVEQGRVLGEIKTVDAYLDATVAALTPAALVICEQALAETREKFGLTDN